MTQRRTSTGGRVHTRFPPEPNGYLHIGHAKSICLNFGVAADFGGMCNLRFDDTNPSKENIEYVNSMKADIEWLGFDWGDRELYASDYFEELYDFAVQLIKNGNAYVDALSATGDQRISRHADGTREGQPTSGAVAGGEPVPVRAYALGRVQGRRNTCSAPR